jgi:hypothetical protein
MNSNSKFFSSPEEDLWSDPVIVLLTKILLGAFISFLIFCLVFFSIFIISISTLPKPYVYDYLLQSLESQCLVTIEQKQEGYLIAYVSNYNDVGNVFKWYKKTQKECVTE